MASIDDVFGSDELLKASHLPPNVSVPAEIATITPRNFDDGPKLEIAFKGKVRRLMTNKTNARAIADFLGERDYQRWMGRTIFIRATKVDFRGSLVDAIRIDPTPPRGRPAPPPPAQQADDLTLDQTEPHGSDCPF